MTSPMRIAYAIFALGLALPAFAQPIAPQGPAGGGPGISPYLNLLRNNTNNANPAFNYLTITRPQMALAQQANQLNQNLQLTNQQLQQQGQGGLIILGGDTTQPVTGHRTTFGNLGGHFNNIGGGGMGGLRIGGGTMGGGQIGMGFQPGAGRAGMGAGAGMGAAMGARGVPGGFGGGIRR